MGTRAGVEAASLLNLQGLDRSRGKPATSLSRCDRDHDDERRARKDRREEPAEARLECDSAGAES
jgi:hypothetical protein